MRRVANLRTTVTLADVARKAGVDQSTVSRVLRDDHRAKATEETRQRIRTVALELGYVPNATARSLAMRRTSTIGLLIPNVSHFIYADVVRGASDAARQLGYVLVVADASELGRAGDAVRELVLAGRVDGLLLASGVITDEITQDLVEGSSNCIILNRQIGSRGPCIIEDDEWGMFLATDELIKQGHRDIVCLAGPADVDTSRRRVEGFREALREAGIPERPDAVAHAGFDEASGYAGMASILERIDRPTAVAAASLSGAIGAMAAVRDRGIVIPDDLSVVAFHDAPLANYLSPPLTTIAMPLEELGREAVRMLHRRLQGDPGPMLVKVRDPAPVIMRRASVGPPPQS